MALLVKQGQFTVPTTNNASQRAQVITGVGFRPKALIFSSIDMLPTQTSRTSGYYSSNYAFATSRDDQFQTHHHYKNEASTGSAHFRGYQGWAIRLGLGTGVRDGYVQSIEDDGFTLWWQRFDTNSPKSVVTWMAIGGDDVINAKAIDAGSPSAGVNVISGLGFQPNTVLFNLAETSTNSTFLNRSVGVATPTGQWSTTMAARNATNSGAYSSLSTNAVLQTLTSNNGNVTLDISLSSFDPDGFTLQSNAQSSLNMFSLALELKEPALVGTFNQPATGSHSVHNVGDAEVKGLLFSSRSEPASSESTEDAQWAWGMTDGEDQYSTANVRGYWGGSLRAEQRINSSIVLHDLSSNGNERSEAQVELISGGFNADWIVNGGGLPSEVAYLAFMQALPVVEASSGLSSSSELAVQVNGSYDTSTSTSSASLMSSVLQATRNDSLTVVADSSLQIGPSAAYGITTTCTFSSDMTAMTSKATDTGSLFESYTDMVPELTRILFGEMSEDANSALTLALQRARFDQWSVSSHSDLSVYPILLIDGSVRLSALSDIEVFPNAVFSSDAFIQTESGIYVRLSPRLMKTYVKVFAQPQIRIAIAKQIGLPHGEFQ